ncbi:MAG: phage Gp37/Gp68 family protein, partial [Mesorhizobium sp.]
MADKSAIEWTDATWNPIVGCSILSPGCTHCYAMGMAGRIEAMTKALKASGSTGVPHYDGTTRKVNGNTIWTGKVALAPDHILTEPLTWRAPRKIFVNSMGDLFHEDVPNEWIDRVFAVMALSTHHTFQILTKRARRMREYIGGFECDGVRRLNVAYAAGRLMEDGDNAHDEVANAVWPLPNVWLGVSAERQQEADERVPELLATPAAVRFVSAEPLLGPIDFERIKLPGIINPLDALRGEGYTTMLHGQYAGQRLYHGLKYGCGRRLDWIIVGGESGPNARPMHLAWARSIRDQCTAAGVPFFFKQWGAWG